MGITFAWNPSEAIPETAVDDPRIDTDIYFTAHDLPVTGGLMKRRINSFIEWK
jgi:hypothetical protein